MIDGMMFELPPWSIKEKYWNGPQKFSFPTALASIMLWINEGIRLVRRSLNCKTL